MKILIINETSDLGGAETMAIELANALNSFSNNEVSFSSAKGVLIGRLDKKIKFFPISRYNHFNIIKLLFEFGKIFRQENFDLIHPQGGTIGTISGLAVKLFSPNTKVVITHHSSVFTRVPSHIGNIMFKKVGDMFIAISKEKFDSFIRSGYSKDKVALIPNFVDQSSLLTQTSEENMERIKHSLRLSNNERIILGVGRLLKSKRFDIFINSLVECARQAPNIKLLGIILGNGPEYRRLANMINGITLPNLRIKLLGFQKDVGAYLKNADLLLFTSEHEVLPMCLIEAISLGIPVVCSNIPGNNDIIEDSYNGFLVDNKQGDYSKSILRILNDNVLARNLSSNCIEKTKKLYDREQVISSILRVYESLIH